MESAAAKEFGDSKEKQEGIDMRFTFTLLGLIASIFFCSNLASAAEKMSQPLGPLDWLAKDRAAWMDASKALKAAELKKWYTANGAANTFIKVCAAHLRSPSPSEFVKVYQRQACYDLSSYLIEYDTDMPAAVRPVRFFHATGMVTSRGLLGYVETRLAESVTPVVGVDARTRELVVGINKTLFELNSGVMNKLIYQWKEPRSPLPGASAEKIASLRFDLDMVQLEQRTVQGILAKPTTSTEAVSDLNDKLKLAPAISSWKQWAKEAGAGDPDFRSEAWRRAIGNAIIFSFHGRSKEEYFAFMKNGTLP